MELSLNDSYSATLMLYDKVANAKALKQLVMNKTIDIALVKPTVILDHFHILAASYKALHLHLHDEKKCRTLHSEILYCLSPSKNISDSFRKFGVGDKDTALLLLEVHAKGESKMGEIQSHVQGEITDISRLSEYSNKEEIANMYKIGEEEMRVGTLLEAVVARIACKDFVSF